MGPFKGCMMVRSNSPVRNCHVNSNDAGLGIPDGAEDPVVANGCAFFIVYQSSILSKSC